ncbi:MAG: biotin/lipoyl-binding protein [Ruminococcaceae bacterium]|nr:biotin/lipoyl-binding protein [Oscillospiraceae bacterium]
MIEIIKNKRGWVKNAAIIFLSVMLILTFFSNTILNWSLPEVSGQYAGYGQIKTAVTGSGTVTALQNYKVTVDQPRTIDSVLVREGDTVEKGQILFILEEYENEELKNAQKTLEDMEYNFQVKMLGREESEFSENLEEIKELEEKLAELKEDRAEADKKQQLQMGSEEIIKIYHNEADKYTQEITELEEQYSLLTSGDAANSDIIAEKIKQLEAAEKELEKAKEQVQFRQEEYDEISQDVGTSYSSAKAAYDSAYSAYQSASQQLIYLQQDYNDLVKSNSKYLSASEKYYEAKEKLDDKAKELSDAKKAYEEAETDEKDAAKAILDEVQLEYDELKDETDDLKEELEALTSVSSSELTSAKRALDEKKASVEELNKSLAKARSELAVAEINDNRLSSAKDDLRDAKTLESNCQKKVDAISKELDEMLSTEAKAVKEKIKKAKDTLKAVNSKLEAEKEKLSDINDTISSTPKQIDQEIKSIEEQIKEAKENSEKLKDKQSKNDTLFALEAERDKKAIEEQKEKVEKLKEKSYTNEVVSKNSGVITTLNVYAGLDVTPGEILAEIELSGSGYVLEIPVTLEQSRKIKVGDKVTVNNYYWGENINMTVSEIRFDRKNPDGNRTVVISVEGDLNYGRTYEVSIGERQTSYDTVVPNRAIREDANGKYILVASVKNTPLGNRYIAKRIDVTVIEKDNVNSAVDTSSEYGYEYVITSSNVPIEDGSQVRLVDN